VRALDERNVWEVESLFFVSSNRNSRVVTVRDSVGEIVDKFPSDVTLPTPRFEVVNSHIRACDKEISFSTKAYGISVSVLFGPHWCCA
jgi:hypothetical protein